MQLRHFPPEVGVIVVPSAQPISDWQLLLLVKIEPSLHDMQLKIEPLWHRMLLE